MFRNLIPLLADDYHVIAPDLPGFGLSDMPDHQHFRYTFDRLAEVIGDFVEQISRPGTRCCASDAKEKWDSANPFVAVILPSCTDISTRGRSINFKKSARASAPFARGELQTSAVQNSARRKY